MNYLKNAENYDRPVWLNAANATMFEPETPVTESPCSLACKLCGPGSSDIMLRTDAQTGRTVPWTMRAG